MSGNLHGKSPNNDQELVRDLRSQIRALEEKQTQRIGDWVLGKDSAGRVVLTNSEGREELLTPDPAPSDEIARAAGDPVFRAARTVTSLHNASAGFQLFQGNWYGETPIECPSFWKWDAAVNSLTLSTRSRLIVELSQSINANLALDRIWNTLLFVNGEYFRSGNTSLYEDNSVSDEFQIQATWVIDGFPGDVLTPGYFCSSSPATSLTADSLGKRTRFEVSEFMSR